MVNVPKEFHVRHVGQQTTLFSDYLISVGVVVTTGNSVTLDQIGTDAILAISSDIKIGRVGSLPSELELRTEGASIENGVLNLPGQEVADTTYFNTVSAQRTGHGLLMVRGDQVIYRHLSQSGASTAIVRGNPLENRVVEKIIRQQGEFVRIEIQPNNTAYLFLGGIRYDTSLPRISELYAEEKPGYYVAIRNVK